jgi:hypothetical protein
MESKPFDDFLAKEDRKKLIQFLTRLYNDKHQWMDEILVKCCVKEHYKSVLENMDREMYFREKEQEEDFSALIDNVLSIDMGPPETRPEP